MSSYYEDYDRDKKKKLTVMVTSGVLMIAMVVAVTIAVSHGGISQDGRRKSPEVDERTEVSAKMKAIKAVCQPTDFQKTCVDSLRSATGNNTTDPKELIGIAFKVAKQGVEEAAKSATAIKELEKDPRAQKALQGCKDLMDDASDDFERSFQSLEKVGINRIGKVMDNLKTWLSATITYQETCLDGFENTTGNAGEVMKKALKTSIELSVNAIAMVSKLSSVFRSLNIGHTNDSVGSRRLLETNFPALGHGDNYPVWLEDDLEGRRRLAALDEPLQLKADIVVAKDGSGNFTTINEAINFIPDKTKNGTVVYIKEGVYEEKVFLNKSYTHVIMVGDGAEKTRITGSLNFVDGTPTVQTATVTVLGDYFMAKNIGFENSAGAIKHQAVALRVGADMSIFYNCSMDGYQDTLYAHAKRQFYRDCKISGTIDFVFGDGSAVFQNCKFTVRKPMDNQGCIVTAQGRNWTHQPTAIVIQNGSIVADPEYYPVRNIIKSYLGRPWRIHSRTIIMETLIDDLIQPEGWLPWDGEFGIKTCYYAEFNNQGPGANKTGRVKWEGVKNISQEEAQGFTPANFFEGNLWIEPSGLPYIPGFVSSNVPISSKNETEFAAAPTPTTADPPLSGKVATASEEEDPKNEEAGPPLSGKVVTASAVADAPGDNYAVRGQPVEAPWNEVARQRVKSPRNAVVGQRAKAPRNTVAGQRAKPPRNAVAGQRVKTPWNAVAGQRAKAPWNEWRVNV
ncbi:hypothetical protein Pint_19681 [Pistacia integerrima]|uniref:Uncharacterized protein n=1 Tax=Pistacia integerrima TaxID=434235 RepID=A0ACC0XD28_9ROSI|nr:hypothetical protein Pint_19681 [Pistacia integerrima]